MKVFISGTKIKINMEDKIKEKIGYLTKQRTDILIGDCCGVDACVQRYLASIGYENVTVYVSGDKTRCNAGNWREEHIAVGNASKGFEFYRAKDVEMAKEADYGIVIWNGKSKGSFANIISFLTLDKKCEVYLLGDQMWTDVHTAAELKFM